MTRYLSMQFPTSGLTLPDGTAIATTITRNALLPLMNVASVQVAPLPDPLNAAKGAITALSLVVNSASAGVFYLGNLTKLNEGARVAALMADYETLKQRLADDTLAVVEVSFKDYDA
jgi:hypothetical protein